MYVEFALEHWQVTDYCQVFVSHRGRRKNMAIMDPISDLFTRIRNALKEKHDSVSISYSVMKESILKILEEEGYILSFSVEKITDAKKNLKVKLKYTEKGQPIISKLERVSKSSKRIYTKKATIPKPLNGYGISIVSTSAGVLSGREARLKNVGGELIGIVY